MDRTDSLFSDKSAEKKKNKSKFLSETYIQMEDEIALINSYLNSKKISNSIRKKKTLFKNSKQLSIDEMIQLSKGDYKKKQENLKKVLDWDLLENHHQEKKRQQVKAKVLSKTHYKRKKKRDESSNSSSFFEIRAKSSIQNKVNKNSVFAKFTEKAQSLNNESNFIIAANQQELETV